MKKKKNYFVEVEKSYAIIHKDKATCFAYIDDLAMDFSKDWDITKKIKEGGFVLGLREKVYRSQLPAGSDFHCITCSVPKEHENTMKQLLGQLDIALALKYGATYFELRNDFLVHEKTVSDRQKEGGSLDEVPKGV